MVFIKKISTNSILILVYLYTSTIVNLGLIVLSTQQTSILRYIIYLVTFILAVLNNKLQFTFRYIFVLLIIILLMLTNLILSSHQNIVLVEILSFLLISLVPFYLLGTRNINYEDIISKWTKLSRRLTLAYPIFFFLYNLGILGYWFIGDITTLNFLPLLIVNLFSHKKNKYDVVYLLINILFGLVYGSRSSIIALIFTSLIIYFIIKEKFSFKYLIRLGMLILLLMVVFFNLNSILTFIQKILIDLGIYSRNIELFILQLKGFDLEVILSGRTVIYDTMLTFIEESKGLPGGLGITRILTKGVFYHSHNIILDFLGIFGIVGTILFLSYYSIKVFNLYNNKLNNPNKAVLFFTLSTYFWLTSFVNAYFLNDIFFVISFAILIFDNPYMSKSKAVS